MDITVKITKTQIQQVRQAVLESTGREPSDHELEKFFRKDIRFMYSSTFEDGLGDAIDAHFG